MQEGGRNSSAWWRMLSSVREGVGEGVGRWFDDNTCRVLGDGRDTLFWYDTWVGDMPLRLKFLRPFDLAVDKECKVAEMWRLGWGEGGAAWEWRRRLLAWEEESVRECSMLLHNIVLQVDSHDTWRWLLDTSSSYTVRGAYTFLTTTGAPVISPDVDVWHKQIPTKVSLFAWCLFRNRFPTKDNMWHRRVIHSENVVCAYGCGFQKQQIT